MAASPADQGAGKQGGGFSLVAFIILTVLAGGGGALFALQVPSLVHSDSGKVSDSAVEQAEVAVSPMLDLPPITTNLAEPTDTWVRMEASVVVNEDLGEGKDVLLRTIAEDLVAYFRTTKLSNLSGPSAFQHMLEDLNERVRIRSDNKIDGIIIQSFILE